MLEVRNLDKSFAGVHAVDHISFQCQPGTVHVLQGENGAGKSTLLKMLSGLYQPDAGEIVLNGEVLHLHHPRDAQRHRIAMVYQELTILPELTVAQNIFLNHEKRVPGCPLIQEKALIQQTAALAERYGVQVTPDALAADLPIGVRQIVEILKALASDPEILILDEPTATLTRAEVDKLYEIIASLKRDGKIIIFVSHRMEEIFRFGDWITIMKDGCLVATSPLSALTSEDIIKMMVGRELKEIFPSKPPQPRVREELLRVEDFGDRTNVHEVSFTLGRGEVLGIAALDGQGQTDLLRMLAGAERHTTGALYLKGQPFRVRSLRQAIRQGMVYVTEDRKTYGLCLGLSVGKNLAMSSLYKRQTAGFIHSKQETGMNEAFIQKLGIKTVSPAQLVGELSGGNQQKVAIGKNLACEPKVLLLNEPTRGIDVRAKQEIYALIRECASQGVGVVMYTSDMMELIGLSDRILTLFSGRITMELTGDSLKEETIMSGMMNVTH